MFTKIFPKIHSEGYKFLVIAAFITIILLIFNNFLGLIGLLLTIWVYYFFRDPERTIIGNDDYLVSPADGEVIKVEEVDGPKEVGLENKKFKKISIFMNVFDCHVNRTPCSGTVEDILYKPGKFFNASSDNKPNRTFSNSCFAYWIRSSLLCFNQVIAALNISTSE